MGVEVNPLSETDLDTADSIFRIAFGTFLELPDPKTAFGDSELFRTRFRARNTRVLAAHLDGTLVGSNVITRWGSVGWFGPLTILPAHWDRGIARALMDETEKIFDGWGVTHRGLFTFPQSPKHLALYAKYGYWPRYLTPIFARDLPALDGPTRRPTSARLYSETPATDRPAVLEAIRELGGTLYPGLDLTGDVDSLDRQRTGETVLLYDDSRLDGVATCHIGAGSEAGGGTTLMKFGAVSPGERRLERLQALLENIEALAGLRGAPRVEAGVNLSHRESYRALLARGSRADFVGVVMQSPDEAAYHRPELDILDDWR